MKKFIQSKLKFFVKAIIKKYNPDIIGITGSVGKSSAKEAIKKVLESRFKVRASIKNYNNEIGLPLTVIGVQSPLKSIFGWVKVFIKAINLILITDKNYPKILILEMGADREGDIKYLSGLTPCKIAIVTAVSESHSEFLGNLQKIEKEKRQILENLSADKFAVLNRDSDLTYKMKDKTKARVISFGFDKEAAVRATDANINYNQKGEVVGINFKLQCGGNIVPVFLEGIFSSSQIHSILIAASVGSIYEMNLIEIIEQLKSFKPLSGRMNLIKGVKKTFIIDDSYNSSPAAVKAALETMREIRLPAGANRIAVLGDMLELGSQTEQLHRDVGVNVVENGVDILITKGEAAREIAGGAINAGMKKDKVFSFSGNGKAGRFLQDRISKNDLILIKGSQGMRMEKIVKEIMAKPMKAKDLLVRQGNQWK
ncbi:MAG: UDP-N-acetylmuramoyl-tripeptide--D-alanyl-D-alanine ligase [Patescibacteria group bacterium]|nr:UDP-N-acetylmuramoyl-tripeptide--D-alanyl-D-alanine ligase [Patescibacteria group bacterium]